MSSTDTIRMQLLEKLVTKTRTKKKTDRIQMKQMNVANKNRPQN